MIVLFYCFVLFSACLLYLVCCCPSVSLVLQSSGQVSFLYILYFILYFGWLIGSLVGCQLDTGWLLVSLVDLNWLSYQRYIFNWLSHRRYIFIHYQLLFSLIVYFCSVGTISFSSQVIILNIPFLFIIVLVLIVGCNWCLLVFFLIEFCCLLVDTCLLIFISSCSYKARSSIFFPNIVLLLF